MRKSSGRRWTTFTPCGASASLTPYGFVRRIGKPVTQGYYILHEGLLGIVGDQGLKEEKYDSLEKEPNLS